MIRRRLLKEAAEPKMKYTVVSLYGHINEDSYEEGEGEQVAYFNGKDMSCNGMSSYSIKELLEEINKTCLARGGYEWEFDMNYSYEKDGVVEFWNDTAMVRIGDDYIPAYENDTKLFDAWKAGKEKLYNQRIRVAVKCEVIAPMVSEEELDAIFKREDVYNIKD